MKWFTPRLRTMARTPTVLEVRLLQAIAEALKDESSSYYWAEAREGKIRFRYLPLEDTLEVSVFEIYPIYRKVMRNVVNCFVSANVSSVLLTSLNKTPCYERTKRYRFPGRRVRTRPNEFGKEFFSVEYVYDGDQHEE